MNFIISVLKDFYECCNMPVKAISSEFDDIYKIGYNDYLVILHIIYLIVL